jgi:excisionase family DNA binding protein
MSTEVEHANKNAGARTLDGPLLRPDEVAALLAATTSWVYDAVHTGQLPCLRVGRLFAFRGMLEEWLEVRASQKLGRDQMAVTRSAPTESTVLGWLFYGKSMV